MLTQHDRRHGAKQAKAKLDGKQNRHRVVTAIAAAEHLQTKFCAVFRVEERQFIAECSKPAQDATAESFFLSVVFEISRDCLMTERGFAHTLGNTPTSSAVFGRPPDREPGEKRQQHQQVDQRLDVGRAHREVSSFASLLISATPNTTEIAA